MYKTFTVENATASVLNHFMYKIQRVVYKTFHVQKQKAMYKTFTGKI